MSADRDILINGATGTICLAIVRCLSGPCHVLHLEVKSCLYWNLARGMHV